MNWTTLYSVEGAWVYADNTTHGLYGRYMELLSQSIAIFKTEPERQPKVQVVVKWKEPVKEPINEVGGGIKDSVKENVVEWTTD